MQTRVAWLTLVAVLAIVVASTSLGRTAAQNEAPASGGSLPIFGVLTDDDGNVGAFQGTVSELVASDDDGELLLDGVLDGLAFIGEDTIRVTGQAFSSSVEPLVVASIPAEEYAADAG